MVDIYSASIKLGYIPKLWQSVRVIFIPKPGKDDYTKPKSFRPISLTSFMLKGLERLIERFLKDFMNANCPLYKEQHAFQEGKSTVTALHALTSQIEDTLKDKEYAVCTFLDIEGAFDNISFDAVSEALEHRNVSQPLIRWTRSFLNCRAITFESHGKRARVTPTKGTP